MEFRKLSDGFGVEVLGVNLSSLSKDEFEQLKKSFYQSQVLVARAQKLTPTQFLQFARGIGPPESQYSTRLAWGAKAA